MAYSWIKRQQRESREVDLDVWTPDRADRATALLWADGNVELAQKLYADAHAKAAERDRKGRRRDR